MPKRKTEAAVEWRNRITSHGEADASSLLANPKNWRIHADRQRTALSDVLDRVGWVQEVIVNQRSGFVVDGHLRIALAITKGERVPVAYVDLTEDEEDLILATFDRITGLADIDHEKLNQLMASAQEDFPDLGGMLESLNLETGEPEVETVAPFEGQTDEDEAPEVPVQPVTVAGDLWILGRHRVLCGDSTSVDALERLMDGAKADMVFTDPPYGVSFGTANHNPRAKRWDKIKNDDREGGDLQDFLRQAFANIILFSVEAAPVYSWSASMAAGYDMLKALTESGLHVQSQIVWVKNCIVLGQADYQWRHEPCWYGWTPGKHHFWAGGRTLSTVWEFSKDPNQSYRHPTQKPVALSEFAITNSSADGALVLDLFGGSGSTLLGCEKTGRAGRLMEFEPKYVDVIVTRWQEFTGEKARLEGDDRTFDEIAASRVPVQTVA